MHAYLMLITPPAFASIIAAVFVTMIAVGIQNNASSFKVTQQTTLISAFTSVSNMVAAYGKARRFCTMLSSAI